jgi:hypothetical protein
MKSREATNILGKNNHMRFAKCCYDANAEKSRVHDKQEHRISDIPSTVELERNVGSKKLSTLESS